MLSWCFSELANQLASLIFLTINFQVGSLYLLREAREIAYLRGRNQPERAMQDIKNGWLSSDAWTFPCLVMEVSAEQAAAGPCFSCCAAVMANSCSPPIALEVPTRSWEHTALCLHRIEKHVEQLTPTCVLHETKSGRVLVEGFEHFASIPASAPHLLDLCKPL